MSEGSAESAVSALVQEHYVFLYRFAYRLAGSAHDAEDLTQQAFLAAQGHLDQLREPAHARAWLIAICRNAYRRSFHKQPSGRAVSLEEAPEPVADPTAEPLVEEEQLQQALAELPEEFRAVIVLYYLEHLNYREIAERLETPIGTVMSRLSRGKSALRRKLTAIVETCEAAAERGDQRS